MDGILSAVYKVMSRILKIKGCKGTKTLATASSLRAVLEIYVPKHLRIVYRKDKISGQDNLTINTHRQIIKPNKAI